MLGSRGCAPWMRLVAQGGGMGRSRARRCGVATNQAMVLARCGALPVRAASGACGSDGRGGAAGGGGGEAAAGGWGGLRHVARRRARPRHAARRHVRAPLTWRGTRGWPRIGVACWCAEPPARQTGPSRAPTTAAPPARRAVPRRVAVCPGSAPGHCTRQGLLPWRGPHC